MSMGVNIGHVENSTAAPVSCVTYSSCMSCAIVPHIWNRNLVMSTSVHRILRPTSLSDIPSEYYCVTT